MNNMYNMEPIAHIAPIAPIDNSINTKKIIYTPDVISKKNAKGVKKGETKDGTKDGTKEEAKKRVVCDKWIINPSLLEHAPQLEIISNASTSLNSLLPLFKQQIESKLYGYKQQDIKKSLHNETKFITFEETVAMLQKSGLICCYCSIPIFVLYENVRDPCQWSLDRINNDMGHNSDNLLIACLRCNLRRRRTNMDSFMFTRKMKLVKGN